MPGGDEPAAVARGEAVSGGAADADGDGASLTGEGRDGVTTMLCVGGTGLAGAGDRGASVRGGGGVTVVDAHAASNALTRRTPRRDAVA